MAFSSELKAQSLAGNVKMEIYSVDFASVTSGTVDVSMSNILHAQFNNAVSDDHGILSWSGKTITISSVTSSDTGTLIVFGNG